MRQNAKIPRLGKETEDQSAVPLFWHSRAREPTLHWITASMLTGFPYACWFGKSTPGSASPIGRAGSHSSGSLHDGDDRVLSRSSSFDY